MTKPLSTHCTLSRLQYSINITFMCIGEPKNCIICFIAMCALLWWSATKPAVSLRFACICISRGGWLTQLWRVPWAVETKSRAQA